MNTFLPYGITSIIAIFFVAILISYWDKRLERNATSDDPQNPSLIWASGPSTSLGGTIAELSMFSGSPIDPRNIHPRVDEGYSGVHNSSPTGSSARSGISVLPDMPSLAVPDSVYQPDSPRRRSRVVDKIRRLIGNQTRDSQILPPGWTRISLDRGENAEDRSNVRPI